jgi:hypothetical protein
VFTPDNAEVFSLDLAAVGVTLQPDTTYYYRALIATATGVDKITWFAPPTQGATQSFRTSSDPEPQSLPVSTAPQLSLALPGVAPVPVAPSKANRGKKQRCKVRRHTGKHRRHRKVRKVRHTVSRHGPRLRVHCSQRVR